MCWHWFKPAFDSCAETETFPILINFKTKFHSSTPQWQFSLWQSKCHLSTISALKSFKSSTIHLKKKSLSVASIIQHRVHRSTHDSNSMPYCCRVDALSLTLGFLKCLITSQSPLMNYYKLSQFRKFVLTNVLAEISISFVHIDVSRDSSTTMVQIPLRKQRDTISAPEICSLSR